MIIIIPLFLDEQYLIHPEYIRNNLAQAEKNKVLFLDIDGVLQPCDSQKRHAHDLRKIKEMFGEQYKDLSIYDVGAVYFDWNMSAIGMLKQLLEDTHTKIVISSDWRMTKSIEQLRKLFDIHNLGKYIADCCSPSIANKEEAIAEYLETHEVDYWAIVDDSDLSEFGVGFRKIRNGYFQEDDYRYLRNVLNHSIRLENNSVQGYIRPLRLHLKYNINKSENRTDIVIADFSHNDPINEFIKLVEGKALIEFLLNYIICNGSTDLYSFTPGPYDIRFFDSLNINAVKKADLCTNTCLCYEVKTFKKGRHK